MNKLAMSVAIAMLMLGAAGSALACKCIGRGSFGDGFQPCASYWRSEAVFVGTAERIEFGKGDGLMTVTFAVERRLRGEVGDKVEVVTNNNTAACGYPFVQGETYVVYGRKGSDGKFQEALCGPTVLLKEAQRDLEYVAQIEAGKSGTMIYGSVQEDRQPTLEDKRTFDPVGNVEVTAKGQDSKKVYTARTDQRGFYTIPEVVPDIYQLTAALPRGMREVNRTNVWNEKFASVRLDGSRCGSGSFVVTRQGSISGKVTNFKSDAISNAWNPDPAQPFLTLLALDAENKVRRDRTPEHRWAYRPKFEFLFSTVPAGDYLLVMNPTNCPYPNNGVQRTFYPGVATERDARIITVKEGESVTLRDFRSLPLLKEKWISGVVVNPDSTPAANVEVRLRPDPAVCSNGGTRVSTDESGRFRIRSFESYLYIIDAVLPRRNGQKELYAPPVRLADIADHGSIELRLAKPPWQAGR